MDRRRVVKMEGIDGGSSMGPSLAMVVVMAVVGSAIRVSHGSGLVLRLVWRVVGLWRK